MDKKYYEYLKEIYSFSELKVLITDENFIISWSNDSEFEKIFKSKSALCIFENGTEIPTSSGKYSGTLHGVSYIYNVIFYNKENERFFIIEIVSTDSIYDFIKVPAVMKYFTNIDANIRQAIFGICNSASDIYEIFEATECYNEISLINVQMADCYKILKTMMCPNEVLKYIYNFMDVKILNLSKYMKNAENIIDKILGKMKACILIETEDDLYIDVDEDRLTYIIVDIILQILKGSDVAPVINIITKKVAGDILISISNGDYNEETIRESMLSPMYEYSKIEDSIACNQDFYIEKHFCKKFSGKLYVGSGGKGKTTVGIRLPFADEKKILDQQQDFNSEVTKYDYNKFSLFHIALSDIYNFEFF